VCQKGLHQSIGVARRGPKGPCHPQFLENITILCFERRFSKQNSVIRLKSSILTPQFFWSSLNFWAGYATATNLECRSRLQQDPAFFFWTQRRSQKFVKNRSRNQFSFPEAGACVFSYMPFLRKNFAEFRLHIWSYGSRSLNRRRILKFENSSDPDPDKEFFEQERIQNLKMWLRPPLLSRRAPN